MPPAWAPGEIVEVLLHSGPCIRGRRVWPYEKFIGKSMRWLLAGDRWAYSGGARHCGTHVPDKQSPQQQWALPEGGQCSESQF